MDTDYSYSSYSSDSQEYIIIPNIKKKYLKKI